MMATPVRRRSSRPRFGLGLLSFVVAVVLLIAAVAFLVNRIGDLISNHGAQQVRTSSTSLAMAKCNDAQAVADLLISQGFKPGDFTVGQDKFNLSLPAAKQVGADSFSKQPLTSREALVAFLKSDDPAAKAAKAHVSKQGSASDAQILDVTNWQGFQLLVPVVWPGNTIFVGGKEKPAGALNTPAGDIGWVFINPNDCTKAGSKPQHIAVLRMGCTNPQNALPRPPPTPTPTPTPVCTPGTHPSPQQPTVCVAPKDGSQDVNVDPSVPGSVQGPGSSIGGNPPPAAPSTDSPTGCNGPCSGSATPTPRPTSPIGPLPTPQPVPSPIASDPPPSTPIPTPPPPG